MTGARYVGVVFDLPVQQCFSYRVPDDWPVLPPIGARVRAPFGPRQLIGFVVTHDGVDSAFDPQRVKPLADCLDDIPALPAEVLQLVRWVADYYHCSEGETCFAAFPFGDSTAAPQEVLLALAGPLEELLARVPARATQKRVALETLAQLAGDVTPELLHQDSGVSAGVIRQLIDLGLIRRIYRPLAGPISASEHLYAYDQPQLNSDQHRALELITGALEERQPRPILLHGVTGSGKTEVFLQAIARALELNRTALVLVPEISLTPQSAARYRARFPGQVVVLHSGLSDGQRFSAWQQIRQGAVSVVVGTRSAIFAPLARLGLIIVDEEHDSSYKQEDPAPRYHARDVAVMRGRLESCPVVLGSATPATESIANVTRNKYHLALMPRRAVPHPLPETQVIDMRNRGPEEFLLSRELTQALEQRLQVQQQSILFLNRRGYSTMLICRQCGYVFQCRHCSVAMVFHATDRSLVCHHCGFSRAEPDNCPACKRDWVRPRGFGTQQVEELVHKTFPQARVMRMDLDTTRRRGAHDEILSSFRQGNIDILIGTQMIAKGLDMPGVTLVGVISADCSLSLPDFRAAERTFALLTQVSGRAGRGEHGGQVIVQTYSPKHYAIRAALEHDCDTFYREELEYRRLIGFPPWQRLVNIRLDSRSKERVRASAQQLGEALHAVLEQPAYRAVRMLGPSESPLYKLRDRFRWIMALTCASAGTLRQLLEQPEVAAALEDRPGDLRLAVDIDPLSMM